MKIAVINTFLRSHIGRMAWVYKELKARGHEIELWGSGHTEDVARAHGFAFRGIGLAQNYEQIMQRRLKPHEYYNEIFFPLALEQIPGVLEYCRFWKPDVMVANTRAFAGVIASMLTGTPVVTHCASGNSFAQRPEDLYGFCLRGDESPRMKQIMLSMSEAFFDNTDDWFNEKISSAYGIRPVRYAVGLCSVSHAIAHSIKELSKQRIAGLPNVFLTGPVVSASTSIERFERFERYKPYCYISLGTCPWLRDTITERYNLLVRHMPQRYRLVLGLGKLGIGGSLVVDGRSVVYDDAPQLRAIESSEFVVCHGGCQTVHEALYYGKPVIGIPYYAELNEMVNSLTMSGAGVALPATALTRQQIGSAVEKIESTAVRSSAQRLGACLRATDGCTNSVRVIESAGTS